MNRMTVDRNMAKYVRKELENLPVREIPLFPPQTRHDKVSSRAKKALKELDETYENVWDAFFDQDASDQIMRLANCGVFTHDLIISSLNELIIKLHAEKYSSEYVQFAEKADYKRAYEDLKAEWDYQQTKIADYDRIKMELHDQDRKMERMLAQNSFIIEQYRNIEKHSKKYISELRQEIDMLREQLRQ